jgi:Ca2+-binding RTX toxin-like protein
MIGGGGPDTYYIDSNADVVLEAAGSFGTDVVHAQISYTLVENVENLALDGTAAIDGTGNGLANILYSGSGNNVLDGGLGFDTASYAFATMGVDVSLAIVGAQATVGSGIDALLNFENLTGSSSNDDLEGDGKANTIDGGSGIDTLSGGLGNDRLIGGGSVDSLVGGHGADKFILKNLGESGIDFLSWDVIQDFKSAEADKIDLSALDADAVVAGDQPFTFIGSAQFSNTNATGQLRFDPLNPVVYGSTDADSEAEFAIWLAGAPALVAMDFLL